MSKRWFIKVDMHIDHAGQHIQPLRINDPGVRENRQIPAKCSYFSVLYSNIQLDYFSGQHNLPVPDDELI
ncbi:hypothetical protein D3C80_1816930 [compost metagenome]